MEEVHLLIYKKLGIVPKHIYFYADDQSALQLLLKSDGWALLPESIVEKYGSKLEVLSMSKEWDAPVCVSFIRNNNKTASGFTSKLRLELMGEF